MRRCEGDVGGGVYTVSVVPRCPVCGKLRNKIQKLCAKCEAVYGSDSTKWPEFVKELRRIQRRYDRLPGGLTGVPQGQRIEHVEYHDDPMDDLEG